MIEKTFASLQLPIPLDSHADLRASRVRPSALACLRSTIKPETDELPRSRDVDVFRMTASA